MLERWPLWGFLLANLWRNSNFLKLWSGQTISEIGSRVSRDGLPFAAVMVLNATPAQMGMLAAVGGLMSLVAGPLAGLAADRYRRLPILIAADLGRAAVLAIVPLAAYQGWLSLQVLYVVVAVAGLLTVFFDVAYQSLLPSLVEEEQLLEGNSKLALTSSTAEVIGPAMTGALIQALTAPRAILFDSISFLLSAASLVFIRVKETVHKSDSQEFSFRDLTAGMTYVAGHPILRPLGLRAGTVSFFFGFFSTLYTLFAVRELGISAAVLGVVIAVGGASNFLGAILAQRVSKWIPLGWVLIVTAMVPGLVTMTIPLARGPYWGALVLAMAQLFGDISYPIYAIHELTLRQKVTQRDMLGRVNASMHMLFKGVFPLGALVGGLLATSAGSRVTLAIAGAGILSSGFWLLFSKVRTLRDEIV